MLDSLSNAVTLEVRKAWQALLEANESLTASQEAEKSAAVLPEMFMKYRFSSVCTSKRAACWPSSPLHMSDMPLESTCPACAISGLIRQSSTRLRR